MGLKFMTADELAEKTALGTITTIYGLADAGKSTIMVTVAEKMRVLYVDSEGKFGKICANAPGYEDFKHNISGVEVRTLKELIALVQNNAIDGFDAIVIDSVTNMVDKELHNIMFEQKRRRTFDDYNDLGTNFMGAIEILRAKGISVFFTIQAKVSDGGYAEPDAQGGLVAKKAIEASDWMFYISEGSDGRTLDIKNNLDCRLKKKGVPEDFADALTGDEVRFASLWDIFPSRPKPAKKITKAQVTTLEKLIETGQELKEFDVDNMFASKGINKKDIKELTDKEFVICKDALDARNKRQLELKKIKKDAESN